MKKIVDTSKPLRRIEIADTPKRRISHEEVAKALGAEPIRSAKELTDGKRTVQRKSGLTEKLG